MATIGPEPPQAATYRLQLRPGFGFAEVAEVAPYLAALGVTHVYLSPAFAARPGSTHGYDVVDPTRFNDELGGAAAFDAMSGVLDAAGLRVLLDIVPNHMAAHDANPWWRDVVEHRRGSAYAGYFDIDWEASGDRLRYRRFFDIDDLVALRQEDDEVFTRTHALVADLVAHSKVHGLRVDHIDGLRDPRKYLERLQGVTAGVWTVVEKILEAGEKLPTDWPVAGTTGYEFGNLVLALLVDGRAEKPLTDLYVELTGDDRDWDDVARSGKLRSMEGGLAPDLQRVARAFGDPEQWSEMVRQAAAHFPVYRTYFAPVDDAVARFQQFTGPVMAKGVEDTAFYEYLRFVALNEVGGRPDRFGATVEEWHAGAAEAATRHPGGLLSTATHDTKRGEDVRARLAVISEMPDAWATAARQWLAAHPAPDPATAYLLLQTAVGAWPIDADRLNEYMRKAVREAGVRTSWAAPDDVYERSLDDAVRDALADAERLEAIVAPLIEPGRSNSLTQTLLRLTAPGVPDTYQGSELWDLSLVDPDNRRPVEFDRRRQLLEELDGMSPEAVLARADEGLPKLLVVRRALALRPMLAREYEPITASGPDRDRVIAYCRGPVAVVAQRFPLSGLPDAHVDLPRRRWHNELTGDDVDGGAASVAALLARFPVALLRR